MLIYAQVNSAFSGIAGLKLPLFIHSIKVVWLRLRNREKKFRLFLSLFLNYA